MKKKLCSVLLFFTMLFTLLPMTVAADAVVKDEIPTKVRLFSYWDERAVTIDLVDATHSINNIKTNSKNLFAMLTGSEYNCEKSGDGKISSSKNSYTIGLRCEKNGTYTVSFDIVDEKNKKVETKEIKIYAYDTPLKSVTFDGKTLQGSELSGKSAKVKVVLTSKNKINKLEYGVYKIIEEENHARSEIVYKTFKNGDKVTFGTKSYYYTNEYTNSWDDYMNESKSFNTGMSCPTYIQITYYDEYTKQNETFTEYFHKLVE